MYSVDVTSSKPILVNNMLKSSSEMLLALDKVDVRFGDLRILEDVSVSVDEGEVVAIMGPNGAGKSTVLKALFGAVPVAAGTVRFHEAPIIAQSHEMVERRVAFVPQGRRVFPSLSVEENLEIGALNVKNKAEIMRRLEEVYKLFPVLKTKRKEASGTLSGGQQQMVAIGRGLMSDPNILLLDEPSLGLSPKMVKEVFASIKLINEKHNTAIVIVEHNLKSLLEIVDRAYVLDTGRVVASGDPKKIVKDGILEKVFMGALGHSHHV